MAAVMQLSLFDIATEIEPATRGQVLVSYDLFLRHPLNPDPERYRMVSCPGAYVLLARHAGISCISLYQGQMYTAAIAEGKRFGYLRYSEKSGGVWDRVCALSENELPAHVQGVLADCQRLADAVGAAQDRRIRVKEQST